MKLNKLARIVALSLLVSAAAFTSFADPARPCSCTYCSSVDPTTACKFNGVTTCGAWLAVTLCPAQ